MIGNVYAIPPQPPVAEDTRYFEAGNLSIGVEYRDLDPEGLVDTYKENPAHLAELLERSPDGGFTDEGLSLHVCGAEDAHEYLRFDVFEREPHYHYNHPGAEVVNNVIEYDAAANGDMLEWALERIEHRLPDMLEQAGGGHLVAGLDPAAIANALAEVRVVAAQARAGARSGDQSGG